MVRKLRAHVTVKHMYQRKTGMEAVFDLAFEAEGTERPPCIAEVLSLSPEVGDSGGAATRPVSRK